MDDSIREMELALIQSHERSRQYEINPHLHKAPQNSKLSNYELARHIEEQNAFVAIASQKLDALYQMLQNTGVCFALADKSGYILYVVGDDDVLEHFKTRNCMPGYRWSEKDIGTCAIGLTLIEQKPLFVRADELYVRHEKDISNAATPIFNTENNLIGVICLSASSNVITPLSLALISQAADSIKLQLNEDYHHKQLTIKDEFLKTLLEDGSKGIVTLDTKGQITFANNRACILLALPHIPEGEQLAQLLPAHSLEFLSKHSAQKGVQEMHSAKGTLSVSYNHIALKNGEKVGTILSICEKNDYLENTLQKAGANAQFTFQDILGNSEAIKSAAHVAQIAARNEAPVLILGETGTGKELFAQAIHNASIRHGSPFIAINCGAIPRELLESELFGYEEGAFTGAQKGGRIGKVESANTGTLFLDEIGDMPFDMQVKLLRVIQSGELCRIGSNTPTKINIRIISATNKDLEKEMRENCFRSDLFYRISTLTLRLPPLRERKEDIAILTQTFIKRHENISYEDITPKAQKALLNYNWPGNIRQLENAIDRAIYLAQGKKITLDYLDFVSKSIEPATENFSKQSFENAESDIIKNTLAKNNGNISISAKQLGMSRPTLYKKMKLFNIH